MAIQAGVGEGFSEDILFALYSPRCRVPEHDPVFRAQLRLHDWVFCNALPRRSDWC